MYIVLKTTFKNIFGKPLRTLLVVFSIFVCSFVAMFCFDFGAAEKNLITDLYSKLGGNANLVVTVTAEDTSRLPADFPEHEEVILRYFSDTIYCDIEGEPMYATSKDLSVYGVDFEAAERMEEHKKERMRRNHFSNLPNIGFAVIMNGLSLFAACWCGYGILKGTMSFGTLTAVTQLVAQIQMPFANISGFVPRYYSMIASAERLMEAERFEEDLGDRAAEEPGAFYDSLAAIGLENVSYSYADRADGAGSEAAVKDLSLEVQKGSWVAFTGHSGCGKTTALKLLMCILKPQSGLRYYKLKAAGKQDTVDSLRTECNTPSEKLPLDSKWRSLFAYVPQGNQLMNGTIREVVSLADPTAASDDARITRALDLACASEFVSQLEDGADTLLGERGCGLSEGQMQRIAIARALFSERPIILLDEATASLDAATERRVLENIKALPGKTVIIVTHRSAALDYCEQVINFE